MTSLQQAGVPLQAPITQRITDLQGGGYGDM